MAEIAQNARRNLILERPRCTSAFQVAISMTLFAGREVTIVYASWGGEVRAKPQTNWLPKEVS
jgi:hypothetical protein